LQAIKQLRREVVDGMRALMKLAKEKQTTGMLPICEDMISKVCASVEGWRLHDTCKILLWQLCNIWFACNVGPSHIHSS